MYEDNNENTGDRRGRILEGAGQAFLRFGFERTSMSDIAAGSGVSRTALYHYFPGKEDVLRAVIERFQSKILEEAADVLDRNGTLEATLKGLLEAKLVKVLALMTESVHGMELINATSRLSGPSVRAADNVFRSLVVSALMRHQMDQDVDVVADTLIDAAKGLLRSNDVHVPKEKFVIRLHLLVDWFVN